VRKRPKCPNCSNKMVQIYVNGGNRNYKPIGYLCKECNLKKFIKYKGPTYKGPLHIGLKTVQELIGNKG
jgi:transposase-like protein